MDIAQDAPQTVLLAEDEAWMYLQATTLSVYAPRGQTPTTRVDPGRAKEGFYGTLNLRTGDEIVSRTPFFNSDTTAAHLQRLLDTHPDVPILLFWDRATWHGGSAVRQVLEANPRLEIIKFPAGAPDLNPQEHVWKLARRSVSHNHLVPKLPKLADQFEAHLQTHIFSSSFLERYGYHEVCPFLN
jgi:putative transposase